VLDVDLDDNPDIVVVNQLSSTLRVFNGDGTGNFVSNSDPVATGGNPSSLVAADFDRDGIEDVAITNSYDGTISVWLGQSNGTFQPMTGSPFAVPPPTSGSSIPGSLVSGDFDGDGRPDLAIADAVNNRVSILLNPVAGMVFTSAASTTGASPASIVTGDFNGDGKADLALANANDSTVTVLLGDGTGSFTASPQSPFANFNAPETLAVLDFEGDGLQGLAAGNVGGGTVSLREQTVAQEANATLSPVTVYGGGTHLIKASYGGDSKYTASSSSTVSVTGVFITTTGAVTASPGASVLAGATAQLTDTITPSTQDNYTATGTVTFKDGSATVGTGSLSHGQAVVSANALAIGAHTITAVYPGDTNFSGNTSAAFTLTVAKASSTTALTSSANPVIVTGAITFTASISSSGSPTGTVNFYDGTTLLGSGAVQAGKASYTTSALAAGTHTITATYTGDTGNSSSTSAALSEVVQDFSITSGGGTSGGGGAPTQTVAPGGTATYQLNFGTTANTIFPDAVTLSVSGLPTGATATLNPASLPAGSTLGSVTLTIHVPSNSAQLQYEQLLDRSLVPAAFALLLLPFSRRTRGMARRMGRVVPVLAILLGSLAGVASLSGCGGKGHPVKSYAITVTATSGTLTRSTVVNLTVK
jgi:Bacterial Ig-like domain (group 3)/FG-GAP-like repeat